MTTGQGLKLTILLLLFCSCGHQNPTDTDGVITNNKLTNEIEKYYWPVDTDTILTEKELSMYNEPYRLTIKKYCFNDSSIINEVPVQNDNDNGKHKALDISHNYIAEITLTKSGKTVFQKNITKETFKDSLYTDLYNKLTIHNVEYQGARTNRLYFTASLAVPDTDWIKEIEFAVFYQTEKLGRLDYW